MFAFLTRLSALSGKTLRIAVLVAIVGAGAAACATYRAWRYPCVSGDPGLRGEVMRRQRQEPVFQRPVLDSAAPAAK